MSTQEAAVVAFMQVNLFRHLLVHDLNQYMVKMM